MATGHAIIQIVQMLQIKQKEYFRPAWRRQLNNSFFITDKRFNKKKSQKLNFFLQRNFARPAAGRVKPVAESNIYAFSSIA